MDPEIRSVKADRVRAADLLENAKLRMAAMDALSPENFSTIIAEGRYEVIKELITALMLVEGYMTLSHESLICYLDETHLGFTSEEIDFLNDFRKLRNDINCRGKQISPDFLKRHEEIIGEVTEKLTRLFTHYH